MSTLNSSLAIRHRSRTWISILGAGRSSAALHSIEAAHINEPRMANTGEDCEEREVEIVVADYLGMLREELADRSYKAERQPLVSAGHF